jgi:hypothetical protein
MNRTLRLPQERVLALDPADIEVYVLAHGWEADHQLSSQKAGVYHLPGDPQAEILLPRDRGFADYALRLGEVLQELATAEGRTAWEVLEDLSTQRLGASPNGPAPSKRETSDGTSAARTKRDAS